MIDLTRVLCKNKIIGKAGFYLSSEIIVKFLPFISIPVLTNLWNKYEFGKFSLYTSAIPLVGILMDLSQRTSVKRFYIDYSKNIFQFITTIYIFCVFWFFCIFSLFVFLNFVIIDSFYTKLLLINAFFFALIEIYLSYLQISEKVIAYNSVYFLRQAFPYLLLIILVLLFNVKRAIVFVYIQFIVFFLMLFLIVLKLFSFIRKNFFDFSYLKYSLALSVPVIPAVLSAFALNFADRYMIAYFYSTKEVAEYSVAYTVAMILSMIVLALNKAWQPFILKNLKKNNIFVIQKYARLYVLAILIIAVILSIFSKWILLFISNESYLDAADIVPVIIGGIFFYFLYTIYSNVAFYYRRMVLFSLPAVIAAIVNIILNFILLPKYGYKIAAWTTLCAYSLEFIVIWTITKNFFKLDLL